MITVASQHLVSRPFVLFGHRNMFPDNLVEAAFQHVATVEKNVTTYRRCPDSVNNVSRHLNETVHTEFELERRAGMNVLGLIVFSIALGVTLVKMGSRGEPLRELFISLNEAVMRLITVVIW